MRDDWERDDEGEALGREVVTLARPPKPLGLPARTSTQPWPVGSPLARARVRAWVHAMVWEGLTLEAAARRFKIRLKAARRLLGEATVQAYYQGEVQVMRGASGSLNVHRAVAIREAGIALATAAGFKASLDAIKFLEGEDGDLRNAPGRGGVSVRVSVAGYVMDLTGDKAGPRVGGAVVDVEVTRAREADPGAD